MKTMILFRSIRSKLVMIILTTTMITLLVSGGVLMTYDIKEYRDARIQDMQTQVDVLALSTAAALAFDDDAAANQNLGTLRNQPSIRAAAIYNSRGVLFAQYVRGENEQAFPSLPDEDGIVIEGEVITVFKRIIDRNEILGTAYIRADYELGDLVRSFLGVFTAVTLGALLISTLLALWLQALITRPILSLVEIARGVVTNKNYSRRATKESEDEVGVLVDAINAMLEQIHDSTRALESSNKELEQEAAERRRAREEILNLNRELEEKVLIRTQELEVTNQELESFCYSVSHDLRGPLRSISGFSQALAEDLPEDLPGDVRRYLDKIIAATLRMSQLIEDLLNLSKISRGEIVRKDIDFSMMAQEVISDLQNRDPEREVDISIWEGIMVNADPKLLRIVLENLLNNAWKFTSKLDSPRIEVGSMVDNDRTVYYVRDNGAGFDMRYADKLFGAFQRLHGTNEFPGTGIGLATVKRVITIHGGTIWCHARPDNGAVFYFTLPHDLGSSGSVDNVEIESTAPETVKTGHSAIVLSDTKVSKHKADPKCN